MKRSLIIIILVFFQLFMFAQSRWVNKAERAYQSHNYHKAARFYEKAYNNTNDLILKNKLSAKLADCFLEMNLYSNALPWINKLYKNNKSDSVIFLYANTEAKSGNISKALQILEEGIESYPDNQNLLRKCNTLIRYQRQLKQGTHSNLTKAEALNSSFSDYSPAWFSMEKLIFSSSRKSSQNQEIDGRTSQAYSDLYISSFDNNKKEWKKAVKLKSSLNSKNNDGTFSYDSINNTGYSMRCFERTSNCIIVSSQYDKKSKTWGKEEIPGVNCDEHSTGHPFITAKGKTLYFVSDMEGGYGGKDIWKVTKKNDGSWSLPINAGNSINTENDEMFPHAIGDSLIFFASDSKQSTGGLDIFYSFKKGFEYSTPVNPGYPFNSTADDFGIIFNKDLKGGFLTSNRTPESSDDIYQFDGYPFSITITGTVTEINSNQPLKNALIVFRQKVYTDTVYTDTTGVYYYTGFYPYTMYNITAEKTHYYPEKRDLKINDNDLIYSEDAVYTLDFRLTAKQYPVTIKGKVTERGSGKVMPGETLSIKGSNQYSNTTLTNENGIYEFPDLKPENSYLVKISKEGYFSESRECKIPQVLKPMTFSKETGYDMDFQLTKIEKKKEIVLNNIYYDFDKATLRPESKEELNKLVSMLKETEEVSVQISSHTDTRGNDSYNNKLSDLRAKTVVDYLIDHGIEPERLIARGYGESKLLIKNAKTEDEHQQNRRTTFKVTEVKEKARKEKIEKTEKSNLAITFRVQIHSTQEPIPGKQLFTEITSRIPDVHVFVHNANGFYKYEIGERESLEGINKIKNQLKEFGYKDCFVTSWYNGKRISIKKVLELINE